MDKTRLRKELEAEIQQMTDLALQHPHEAEQAVLEFQQLWVEGLKAREPWVCNLPDTRPYQVLLHLLYTAKDVKAQPILQQVFAVQATIEFLTESNFPSVLIKPLRNLVGDLLDLHRSKSRHGKPGARPKPHNEATQATIAAAAVTALAKGRGVDAALKMVSKVAGLDVAWLREFRKNLQRGIGDYAPYYRTVIAALDRASTEQVLGLFPKSDGAC